MENGGSLGGGTTRGVFVVMKNQEPEGGERRGSSSQGRETSSTDSGGRTG